MQTLRRVSRWIDATADSLKQSSVVFSDMGDCFGLGQRRPLGVADDLVAPAPVGDLENHHHSRDTRSDVADVSVDDRGHENVQGDGEDDARHLAISGKNPAKFLTLQRGNNDAFLRLLFESELATSCINVVTFFKTQICNDTCGF